MKLPPFSSYIRASLTLTQQAIVSVIENAIGDVEPQLTVTTPAISEPQTATDFFTAKCYIFTVWIAFPLYIQ